MSFKNVIYWALVIFLAALFVLNGAMKFGALDMWQQRFVEEWGLPAWMVLVTGALELAGGIMLLVPRLTPIGAAIIVVVMIGATLTHVGAGEWARTPIPLTFGAIAATIAQWSRSRRSSEEA